MVSGNTLAHPVVAATPAGFSAFVRFGPLFLPAGAGTLRHRPRGNPTANVGFPLRGVPKGTKSKHPPHRWRLLRLNNTPAPCGPREKIEGTDGRA
jgi:hypothetical protein